MQRIMMRVAHLCLIVVGIPSFVYAQLLSTVGYEPGDNGYNQIFLMHEGERKVYLTDTEYSNVDPVFDGTFVSWIAHEPTSNKVMMTHRLARKHIRLSGQLQSANLQIDGGRVVWEEYMPDKGWRIFLFDGYRVQQISEDVDSYNAYIKGNYVVFSSRLGSSDWSVVLYNIQTGEHKVVYTGLSGKKALLVEGQIVLYGKGYSEPTGQDAEDILPNRSESIATQIYSIDNLRSELQLFKN